MTRFLTAWGPLALSVTAFGFGALTGIDRSQQMAAAEQEMFVAEARGIEHGGRP